MRLRHLVFTFMTIFCSSAVFANCTNAQAGEQKGEARKTLQASEAAYLNRSDGESRSRLFDAYTSLLKQFPNDPISNHVRWRLYILSDDPLIQPSKRTRLAARMLLEIVEHAGIKSTDGSNAALKFAEHFSNHRHDDDAAKGLAKAEELIQSLVKEAIMERNLGLEYHARASLGRILMAKDRNDEGVKKLLDVVKSFESLPDDALEKIADDAEFGSVGILVINARATAKAILDKSDDPKVAKVIRSFLEEHLNLEGNAKLEKSVEDFDEREKRRPKAPNADQLNAKKISSKDSAKQRIEFLKRHPLRADPKLRAKLSIVHSDPEMTYLLARLADATTLHFTMSDSLVHHAPKNGEFLLKDVFAYSVMEVIAERDLTDGRWVKTDDGYRLEGESRALRLPPPTPPVWPWVIAAVALAAVASAGVYRWRFKKSR